MQRACKTLPYHCLSVAHNENIEVYTRRRIPQLCNAIYLNMLFLCTDNLEDQLI